MKEYIRSGGDVTVVVASDKEVKVQPVREAFQKVLGHATIYGVPSKVISLCKYGNKITMKGRKNVVSFAVSLILNNYYHRLVLRLLSSPSDLLLEDKQHWNKFKTSGEVEAGLLRIVNL